VSDPTSIFPNQNTPTPVNPSGGSNTPPGNSNDQLATLLAQIKNDRGEPKYKSVEDALNALRHSQDYIPQLSDKLRQQEQELAAARASASKIEELERTLAALTQNNKPADPPLPGPSGLSKEEIAELVSSTLSNQQKEAIAKQNLSQVVSTLTQSFGDKAEEVFYGKAKEVGMSVQEINELAAKSPAAAYRLLGIGDAKPNASPATPGINTGSLEPKVDSFISKNNKPTLIGATTNDLREESVNAKKMVEELHKSGLSTYDLTDPKVYFKHFK
jgi:hypothetical protein